MAGGRGARSTRLRDTEQLPETDGMLHLGMPKPKQPPPHTPVPHPADSNTQNASSPSQGTGEARPGLKQVNRTLPQPSGGDRQGHIPTGAGRSGRAGRGRLPRHGRSVLA